MPRASVETFDHRGAAVRPMAEPRRRRNGAAVRFVVFVLFTLGVTEAALRIGQPLLPPLRLVDYKTGPWLVANDPRWEVWHVPNATTVHYKSCFAAHYSSNAFGMRDGPRTPSGCTGHSKSWGR